MEYHSLRTTDLNGIKYFKNWTVYVAFLTHWIVLPKHYSFFQPYSSRPALEALPPAHFPIKWYFLVLYKHVLFSNCTAHHKDTYMNMFWCSWIQYHILQCSETKLSRVRQSRAGGNEPLTFLFVPDTRTLTVFGLWHQYLNNNFFNTFSILHRRGFSLENWSVMLQKEGAF